MKEIKQRGRNQVQCLHSLLEPRRLQEELMERCKAAALALGAALLEEEVAALCGAPFSRKGESLCYRGGSDETSIVVSGAKYRVRRPRVRNERGEVELKMLSKLQEQDLLDEKIHLAMLKGVSTRNYDKVVEGYSEKLGVSMSSTSRAFVRASTALLCS